MLRFIEIQREKLCGDDWYAARDARDDLAKRGVVSEIERYTVFHLWYGCDVTHYKVTWWEPVGGR